MNSDHFALARKNEARGILDLIQGEIDAAVASVAAVESLEEHAQDSDIPALVYRAISEIDQAATALSEARGRLVLYLHEHRGQSYRDIGEAFGVAHMTAKRWILKAAESRAASGNETEDPNGRR